MSRVVPLLMVLYSNDAVEIRYSDGSTLQLSSCGSTMIHHGAHSDRMSCGRAKSNTIHKRSRFVTSEHRHKVLQAMDFRNRFAERPYLCEELLNKDQIVALYAYIGAVAWPSDSAEANVEILQDGSRKVTSLEDYASLVISPHGHDFTVCYLSKISPDSSKPKSDVPNMTRLENSQTSPSISRAEMHPSKAKTMFDERKSQAGPSLKSKEAVVHPFQSNIQVQQSQLSNPVPHNFQTQSNKDHKTQERCHQSPEKCLSPQHRDENGHLPIQMSGRHLKDKDPNTRQEHYVKTPVQQDPSPPGEHSNHAGVEGSQDLPSQPRKHSEPFPNSSINSQDISSISRSSTPDGLRTTIDSDASLGTHDGSGLVLMQACPREVYRQRHSSPTHFTSSPYEEPNKIKVRCNNGLPHVGGEGTLGGSYLDDDPFCEDGSVEDGGLDKTVCEEDPPPEELSRTVIGEESEQVASPPLQQMSVEAHITTPAPGIPVDNPMQTGVATDAINSGVRSGIYRADSATTQMSYPSHARDSEFFEHHPELSRDTESLAGAEKMQQKSQCQSLYVWTTAHMSRNACAPAWVHPLKLVQTPSSQQDHHHQGPSENKIKAPSKGKQASPLPMPLPVTCPFQHMHKWDAEKTLDVSDMSGSLEFQHGMLKVIISEGIVYRFVTVANIHIVEIHPGDGSVIVSQGVKGHFYTHYIAVGDRLEERTYSLKSLPPEQGKGRYSISKLIQTAYRYLMMNHQWERRGLKQELPCWKRETVAVVEPLSSSLLEECVVDGLGKFSAFTNGRVRAVFEDRTALDMVCNFSKRVAESLQRGHEHQTSLPAASQVSPPVSSYETIFGASSARLLLPSGQYVTVDIQSPGQYKSYIQAGKEWASWVNSSPMERHQFYTQNHTPTVIQRAAEHELKKIFCFNYILEQTLHIQQDLGHGGNRSNSSPGPPVESETSSSHPLRVSSGAVTEDFPQALTNPSTHLAYADHLRGQGSPDAQREQTKRFLKSSLKNQKYQQVSRNYNYPSSQSFPAAPQPSVATGVQIPSFPAMHQYSIEADRWRDTTHNPEHGPHLDPSLTPRHGLSKDLNVEASLAMRSSTAVPHTIAPHLAYSDEKVQFIKDGFQAVRQVLLRNSNLINDIDEFLDSSRKQDQ